MNPFHYNTNLHLYDTLSKESTTRLVPPWLSVGTEVGFGPWREDNLSTFINITVGKGERKWCRSTYYSSGRGILRSMAWAHEFIVWGGPWHNTSQVSAHCVKSIALESLVFLYDKVSSISLQTLGKGTVICQLALKVRSSKKIISKGVLGSRTSGSASSSRRNEEQDVWNTESGNSQTSGSNEDEVHDITTVLVDVKLLGGSVH